MNIPKYMTEFRNEITRKGYRPNTIKNYVPCVEAFLNHFNKIVTEPIKINETQIKEYLRLFPEHNTQRSIHSAIKCFYSYVIKQPDKFKYIEYCKRNRKLPIVHSQEEIQRLINACTNLKHRAIICVMYACGLRVSEVVNLKITDVDSSRMVINIKNAKGGKDRQVCLPEKLLKLLRQYYIAYKPKEYLFNGQNAPLYSTRSIAEFLNHYNDKAGLNKRIYPHLLRHDALTHMLEGGTDISIIQKVAGHQSIKTTQGYTHISSNIISKVNSPLQAISL